MTESEIILLYLSGKTTYDVADICKRSQTFIMNILKKNNINRRSTKSYTTIYIPNENFFDIIDTEENAYFLGLMYADGNNYINKHHNYEISIKLQAQDKIILEKFRDLISPNSKIKIAVDKSTPNLHYRLKVNSKKISEQLCNLGCVPNKSLILQFPTFIPNKLIPHFIRGYSDGDGSIYKKQPTETGYINYCWQITSTIMFNTYIKNILEKELQIHFSQSLSRPKTNNITTTLSVGGNIQVMKALDWLYKDATIYLPRKYDKYIEFKNYSSSSKSSAKSKRLRKFKSSSLTSASNKSLKVASSAKLNSVP
tara:strand:+ start:13013 stop:13945 length:933 start_codon:yes stop_codon:yes gene_type:complete